MAVGIYQGIRYFLEIISYMLLIYCVLSWLMPPYHKVMMVFARFVDPLLRPIRAVMYRLFPRARFDFSIFVAFLLLNLLQRMLLRLFMLFV